MRFSLKWLLAGMVYAAIVAAAFAKPHWAYADILWGVTLLAFAYAAILTCYRRGKAQSRAVGFLIVSLSIAVCLCFVPDAMPTRRILNALGAFKTQVVFTNTSPTPAPGSFIAQPAAPFAYGNSGNGTLYLQAGPAPPPLVTSNQPTDEALMKLRAANAVATMLAGLIGCLLGVVAYRGGRVLSEGEL